MIEVVQQECGSVGGLVQYHWMTRPLLLLATMPAAFFAYFFFALGTCHDAGGFCVEDFGGTHLVSYGVASLLGGATGAMAAGVIWLRLLPAVIGGGAAALAVALLALFHERA